MTTEVIDTIDEMGTALSAVADVPIWSLSGSDLVHGLRGLAKVRARLAELELRLAHRATLVGIASEVGAADTRAWWSNTTRQTRRDTHRRLAVAAALDMNRHVTRAAMARGEVAEDQATVIVRALDALPADLGREVVDRAEKELVRLAEHHDAADLTRLGKRVLDVVAPGVADDQERRVLEREEEAAARVCRLTITDDGHGRTYLRGTVPSVHGAMLRKALMGLSSPRRTHETRLKPGPERMGRALCEYVERYPVERLPDAGGLAATVVVTMTLRDFTGDDDRAVVLDTGQSITVGQARRIACEAGILPVVLDGASRPLDVGRQKRLHTPAQRIAIGIRDKTCTADGCDYPPSLCHVHHDIPWSNGGNTTVGTGRLLCPKHHRIAHQPKYTMKHINNGRVIFSRT